jgi:hypothetical protein
MIARSYIAALFFLVLFALSSTVVLAEQFPTQEVMDYAGAYELNPFELQGAVNTSGLDPRTYLVAIGVVESPKVAPPLPALVGSQVLPQSGGYKASVRVTHYNLDGVTYGCTAATALCGTRPGGTACSTNFALGTRFQFPSGEVFICNDRGSGLGSTGWLDVWRRPDISNRYGPTTTVTVLP